MKRPFAALLLLGACACDAPSIADPPISKVEKPNQEKSQEDRREHEAGFGSLGAVKVSTRSLLCRSINRSPATMQLRLLLARSD